MYSEHIIESGEAIKSLTPAEAQNPIGVLQYLFEIDSLTGHLLHLKLWRDCIISDKFYISEIWKSPVELLHNFNLTCHVFEACWILSQSDQLKSLNLSKEELAKEKKTWREEITILPESYLMNPLTFLQQVFNERKLSKCRSLLYEWFEHGLSHYRIDEVDLLIESIPFFETVQQIYSIARVITYRTTNVAEIPLPPHGDSVDGTESGQDLYALDLNITDQRNVVLTALVNNIKNKIKSAELVFYLGSHSGKVEKHYVLVLVGKSEVRATQTIVTILEDNPKLASDQIIALVHFTDNFSSAKNNAKFNRFFIEKTSIIYHSGDIIKSDPHQELINDAFKVEQRTIWKKGFEESEKIIANAQLQLESKAFNECLFSMQQSAEILLTTVISAITGYKIVNHNIYRLLRYTEMFTASFVDVFEHHPSGSRLLKELKEAYVNVKYKIGYTASEELVNDLRPVIRQLLTISLTLRNQFMLLRKHDL